MAPGNDTFILRYGAQVRARPRLGACLPFRSWTTQQEVSSSPQRVQILVARLKPKVMGDGPPSDSTVYTVAKRGHYLSAIDDHRHVVSSSKQVLGLADLLAILLNPCVDRIVVVDPYGIGEWKSVVWVPP